MAGRFWVKVAIGASLALLLASCSDDEVEDAASGGSGGSGGSGASGGSGGSGGSTAGAGGSGASGGSLGGTAGASGGTAGASGGTAGASGGTAGASGGTAGASGGAAGADAGGGSSGAEAGTDGSLDGGASFPAVLFQGVWFAGWAGGLDHFSWMRLTEVSPGQAKGTWVALDSKCTSCTPYFPCEGKDGLFIASTSGPMTLTLQYPTACAGDSGAPGSEEWTFKSLSAPGSFPPGALLEASVQVGTNPANVISAYLYPSSQCNPAFTSCTNPF